ncbi:MAG: GyrI-like domain-containing protein [Bdellovibrionaceae bacterium]|nr:GyrI-like domain-containing protein [Pseudobdellovibrionaceae bacterium]
MKSVFLGVLLFAIGLVGWATVKLGFFKDVIIAEQPMPEMHLVYLEHVGPYHKILDSLEKVEAWAKTANVDCSKSFGHFLDDPEVVEHERLRSDVGCIIDQIKNDLPDGFKTKTIPAAKYFVAESMGSPAIGPMKVYPKARQQFTQRNLTPPEDVLEIYHRIDENTMKTLYLFRLPL